MIQQVYAQNLVPGKVFKSGAWQWSFDPADLTRKRLASLGNPWQDSHDFVFFSMCMLSTQDTVGTQ